MRRALSIRYLLLIANAFIFLVPVFAVVFLHLWDAHLVRVTEQQLIAESVLIGEAWRQRLVEEAAPEGGSETHPYGAAAPRVPADTPPHGESVRIEPVLDL